MEDITIRIYYSFEIKNKKTNELIYYEKDTFDMVFKNDKSFTGFEARDKVRKIAKDKLGSKDEYVSHANYYKSEKL